MIEIPKDLNEKSEKIVTWLKNHQKEIGSVLKTDLKTTPLHAFDLSSGSSFMAGIKDPSNVETFTDHIFQAMKKANAQVGIGRYDEARLLYTTDQFMDGEKDEARTIHVGLDLFVESGTPVFAPLDGKVHSFQNNDLPLDYGPCVILEHEPEEGLVFYTLFGHLSKDSLNGKTVDKTIKKGEQIAKIGNYPVNGGWPPHLHFQIISDMMDWKGNYPGVASPSQRGIWLTLCPNPNLILGIPDLI